MQPARASPRRTARMARMAGLGVLYQAAMARLPLLYFAWAVLAGSVIVWVMPPWQNADEGAHVLRAVQIALGHPIGTRLEHSAGGLADPNVNVSSAPMSPVTGHPAARVSEAMLAAARVAHWGPPGIAAFDNTATYAPFLYAASVPAVWIGRGARMSVVATLRLIRLFDLVASAALGMAALALAQRTRLAIAAMLLLPMSLALAASASQDALLLPLSALVIALIDRARLQPGTTGHAIRHQALTALLLLLVILARPPYLPLVALLLLLPSRGPGLLLGVAAGVAAMTVLWSAYVALRITVPMHGAVPATQMQFLVGHPLAFPRVLGLTLYNSRQFFVASAIGILGWLDVALPGRFIQWASWAVLLGLLSAATPDGEHGGWWRNRVLLGVAAVLASVVAIFLSIYLVWTPRGAPVVEGVQGRYFLPLLPALALALPNLGRLGRALRPPALLAVLALAVVTPAVTLTSIVDRYYLTP